MKYGNVLVVGGSGFIGRHLVASLAAAGIRVTVPSRRRERAKHLILLPTVDVVEADVMRPEVLQRLCAGKQAVDNLVGILHSRRGRRDERGTNEYGPEFARAHVELPQAIIAACRATGVRAAAAHERARRFAGRAFGVPALQGDRRAGGARRRRPGRHRVPSLGGVRARGPLPESVRDCSTRFLPVHGGALPGGEIPAGLRRRRGARAAFRARGARGARQGLRPLRAARLHA